MNRAVLDAAVTDATAALAFADAVPIDVVPAAPERFEIALLAPAQGRLVVEVSESDARALAEAAWGHAWDPGPEAVEQFVGELLNVVAGHYLATSDPGAVPRLGFPQRAARPPAPDDVAASYDVGGAVLRFSLAG